MKTYLESLNNFQVSYSINVGMSLLVEVFLSDSNSFIEEVLINGLPVLCGDQHYDRKFWKIQTKRNRVDMLAKTNRSKNCFGHNVRRVIAISNLQYSNTAATHGEIHKTKFSKEKQ